LLFYRTVLAGKSRAQLDEIRVGAHALVDSAL